MIYRSDLQRNASAGKHTKRLPDGVVHTAVGEQIRPQGFLLDLPTKGFTNIRCKIGVVIPLKTFNQINHTMIYQYARLCKLEI